MLFASRCRNFNLDLGTAGLGRMDHMNLLILEDKFGLVREGREKFGPAVPSNSIWRLAVHDS